MRRTPALIVAAGLVAIALSGCAAGGSSNDCTGGAAAGDASKLVTATGEFGSVPTVKFPTPLKAPKTQTSVLIGGTGAGVIEGQKLDVEMSVFNGTTGKLIEKTEYGAKKAAPLSLIVSDKQTQKGIAKGLTCAQEGSRVAVVVPPADAFGDAGNPQIGLSKDDNLVIVIDVEKAYLTRANGAEQPAQAGFPSVVLAADGRPGITIPAEKAPKTLKVAILKKGDGATVKKGDSVTVHYTGVLWDDKTVFDSSWERGYPATFVAASGADVQGGVIEGYADALVGQKVGSQIIAIIPPDKGYGDKGNGAVPAGATLVFVVDILGVG